MAPKRCLECSALHTRNKYCSRLCSTRACQKMNRLKINQRNRQRLRENPVEERKRRAEQARKWRAKHPENSRKHARKRIQTGELVKPDDVIFYGYKEPLRKFKDGFGYQGVLMYSKEKDKVQCHFCGRLFRHINNGHLKHVHKITALKYKEKVGLSPTTALIGEGTRAKLLERPYNPNHMVELRKAIEKRRERKKKGLKDLQSGKKLSLERKNERGTCPDQLLDIIRKTVKSYGKIPTDREFLQFHNGKFMGSIRSTFGGWTNALKELNLQPHTHRTYSDEDLIREISTFFKVNKRTPRFSDFQRGLLPSPTAYYNRFKNLNHARLLAQVPLIIHVGSMRQEWSPSSLERKKMLSRM